MGVSRGRGLFGGAVSCPLGSAGSWRGKGILTAVPPSPSSRARRMRCPPREGRRQASRRRSTLCGVGGKRSTKLVLKQSQSRVTEPRSMKVERVKQTWNILIQVLVFYLCNGCGITGFFPPECGNWCRSICTTRNPLCYLIVKR